MVWFLVGHFQLLDPRYWRLQLPLQVDLQWPPVQRHSWGGPLIKTQVRQLEFGDVEKCNVAIRSVKYIGKTNLFNSIKGKKLRIPDGILAAVFGAIWQVLYHIAREAAETRPRFGQWGHFLAHGLVEFRVLRIPGYWLLLGGMFPARFHCAQFFFVCESWDHQWNKLIHNPCLNLSQLL